MTSRFISRSPQNGTRQGGSGHPKLGTASPAGGQSGELLLQAKSRLDQKPNGTKKKTSTGKAGTVEGDGISTIP